MEKLTMLSFRSKFWDNENCPTIWDLKTILKSIMREKIPFYKNGKWYNLETERNGEMPSDHKTLIKLLTHLPIKQIND